MLKKIMPTLAICLMLMIFGGCACGETGMMATPAPTMQPTTTPETSPETSAMPDMAYRARWNLPIMQTQSDFLR